jgi:hypothetical protein
MNDAFGNLQKFIANNYELEKLEANLNEFNPLKILKVDQYEIRHSNILSWLLTPNENHNIGSSFLKKFLAEVIIHNENLETKRTVFEIQDMSYQDVIVKREWNDIDIFIAIPSRKFAIIIENKINAKESKGQLKKYYDLVTKEYGTYDVIPVFLTLEGVTPSDVRYGTISYSQILHMLDFIASIQKENLNEKVYDFINYYLRVLGNL